VVRIIDQLNFAPLVARQAILNTLQHLGMIESTRALASHAMKSLHLYEVVDKQHDADTFTQAWASFDRLRKNQIIGFRHEGDAVVVPEQGYIVFPDTKSCAGEE